MPRINFFSELKRRNVYKVALSYAVVSWLILQIGSIVLPSINAPDWAMSFLIFLIIIGFPIACLLAWAQGLKKKEKGHQKVDSSLLGNEKLQSEDSAFDPLTIAVLPFQDISRNKDQEYFSDGMAEETLNLLAKIPGLKVMGRTSSFSFRGQSIGIKEIGRKLNVAHLLEGSVRKSANNIRVSVQLINAQSGFHLWSQQYNRELDDIFSIQDEIAGHIVENLKLTLNTPKHDLNRPQAKSVKAYDLYLRGKYHFNKRTRKDNLQAIELLLKSIAEDANFALGHGMLAQAYTEHFFTHDPDSKWESRASKAIDIAIDLDPNISEIYVAKGNLLWTRKNGFPHIDAINYHKRALEINEHHAEAHNELARIYWHIGLMKQAVQSFDNALATNPELVNSIFRKGWFELHSGRFMKALELFEKVPKVFLKETVLVLKAKSLLYLGETKEANLIINDARIQFPTDPEIASARAIFFALNNENRKSENEIQYAINHGQKLGHYHHITFNIAQAYAIMKNEVLAVKWLKYTRDDGFPCFPWFDKDPLLDPIRLNNDFISMLAEMEQQWLNYKSILNE